MLDILEMPGIFGVGERGEGEGEGAIALIMGRRGDGASDLTG
jgi:hypothetical protein